MKQIFIILMSLLFSIPAFAQFGYDEQIVRSKYIEPLKEELRLRISAEQANLRRLNNEMMMTNDPAVVERLEGVANEIMAKQQMRQNVCLVEEMRGYLANLFDNNCSLNNIRWQCEGSIPEGATFGPSSPSQQNPNASSVIADPENSELTEALQSARGLASDTSSSVDWRSTAIRTTNALNDHLKKMVTANQSCAQALAQAQAPNCKDTFKQIIGDYNQEGKEHLLASCTEAGIDNLLTEFSNYMMGDGGAASVIHLNANRHKINRRKAISILQSLQDLNRFVEMSAVRPEPRPE